MDSLLEPGELPFSPWQAFPAALLERTATNGSVTWREWYQLDVIEDGAGHTQSFGSWEPLRGSERPIDHTPYHTY